MRRLSAFALLGLAALASAQYPGAQPPPANLRKGFDSINESEARRILGFLAGPDTEGRGTGQPGFGRAAEFVAARFKAAGLKPLGDDGTYLQHGTVEVASVSDVAMATPGGATLDATSVSILPKGKDLDVTAGVVIVRADADDRLSAEQTKALEGKIVVALVPPGALVRRLGRVSGATVLTVVDRVGPVVAQATESYLYQGALRSGVAGRIARKALGDLGTGVDAFVASTRTGPALLALPRDAHLTAKGRLEDVRVPNVVGMIEGSDPTLKAEVVGVGGHLDHLGVTWDGNVYPGADDDGSGSTAVMLVAQAIAANPVKPKRSIVFMTFYGEELGLLGSAFLADHPPVPLDKMVAELQMDMVGRDSEGAQNGDRNRMDARAENVDTIRLVGSKRISTDLDRDIQEMNRYVGFRFKYDAEDVYTRSDHYNFASKGVPIAFLFDGFHPDYHRPTDTLDKIDWTKLTNAARLYYLTAMKVANDPAPPRKDVKGDKVVGKDSLTQRPYDPTT